MDRCPNCGYTGRLDGYPPPDRTGERVRVLIDLLLSPGPSYTPKLYPAGTPATIVGACWPRGYSLRFDDGSRGIVPDADLVRV